MRFFIALFFLILSINAFSEEEISRIQIIKEKGELIAGIRRDNPPHSFIDNKGNWVGFDVDIATAIAGKLGVKLTKTVVDELTRISFLKAGKIDVAFASMSHTWKRDEQIDFSQTYFWASQTFLVKKGSDINSLKDLIGKNVAMSRGSHAIGNWRDWHKKYGATFNKKKIIEFGNKKAAIQAVLTGKVKGYAEDTTVLTAFVKKHTQLMLIDDVIGMKQDGIGIQENDSKMRDAINYALQEIEKSGVYKKIYLRWFGVNSNTPIPLVNHIEVWPHG